MQKGVVKGAQSKMHENVVTGFERGIANKIYLPIDIFKMGQLPTQYVIKYLLCVRSIGTNY